LQPELRKSTDAKRETRTDAIGASPTASGYESGRDLTRNLAVCIAAGVFLALVGALGTDRVAIGTRLLFWVPVMIGGAAIAHFVAMAAVRIPRAGNNLWIFGALLAVMVAIPITLLVWAHSGWVLDTRIPVNRLHLLYGPVLLISVAMTALIIVVGQPGRVTHAPAPDAPPVRARFLERLPAKLKGAVVYAISAEDHYLRLHTSKGSDLILMRLSDAITELDGLEGAQTHRSWWVAREAVEGARRDGDKVVLTLKGGAEAPVSRPNVRPLREAGWF
jgi:DNA-binding LytR/AlgR family response regulator